VSRGDGPRSRPENRAVFLDRDGVINRVLVRDGRPCSPPSLDELEILPGVEAAIRALRAAGFLVIVVTNQPDVATGKQGLAVVEAMHRALAERLMIDDFRVCYEVEHKTSRHYKPKPGMLLEAAEEHGIDLRHSFMVGDRWRDVGAGKAAGCFTIFIDYGYKERRPDKPDATVASLSEAAEIILGRPVEDGTK